MRSLSDNVHTACQPWRGMLHSTSFLSRLQSTSAKYHAQYEMPLASGVLNF